jgi:tRNA pseudouridine55 synthase
LYKLARQGEVVERPARDMTVYSLEAERLDEHRVKLNVRCSSGFYIRSLAHDLGQVLGCGAHVIELRRTAIKEILVEQAISLEQLETMLNPQEVLQPIDSLVQDMPRLVITDSQALSLSHGKKTSVSQAATVLSRLYTADNQLFGIGQINEQSELKTHKMFVLAE